MKDGSITVPFLRLSRRLHQLNIKHPAFQWRSRVFGYNGKNKLCDRSGEKPLCDMVCLQHYLVLCGNILCTCLRILFTIINIWTNEEQMLFTCLDNFLVQGLELPIEFGHTSWPCGSRLKDTLRVGIRCCSKWDMLDGRLLDCNERTYWQHIWRTLSPEQLILWVWWPVELPAWLPLLLKDGEWLKSRWTFKLNARG